MQTVDTIRDMQGVLHAVTEATGLDTAIFSRIERERWCAQAVLDRGGFGIQPGDIHRLSEMMCHQVRLALAPIAVCDLPHDGRFQNHPTYRKFGARAYIGVPVQFDDGTFVGTLSALSRQARPGADSAVPLMTLLGQLIAHELQLVDQARHTEDRLTREQSTAEERERFLALVAHDLRNPLSAIRLNAELLAKQAGPEQRAVTERILAVTARMCRLIDDLLDLSRGRLGSGVVIRLRQVEPGPFLSARLAEIRTANPGVALVVEQSELPARTDAWDPDRVAQILDNVVGNAIQHGEQEPVQVWIRVNGDNCEIDVINGGPAIPDDISHQIALAHGGDITAKTREGHTCLRVTLPL